MTAPAMYKQPIPNAIQLAVRIFCCLSSKESWARDAGGLVRTLNLRNHAIAQNDAAAPKIQRITGNLMVYCARLFKYHL
jgi:hypothetical protein